MNKFDTVCNQILSETKMGKPVREYEKTKFQKRMENALLRAAAIFKWVSFGNGSPITKDNISIHFNDRQWEFLDKNGNSFFVSKPPAGYADFKITSDILRLGHVYFPLLPNPSFPFYPPVDLYKKGYKEQDW